VTPSLIDHRPRGELVAELYDRHAAGLFAYCHDQLGDTTSAADALVAVLTSVPAVEPPRAALYALARREIYRRDVAYALPSVDPAADPATFLIERVLREMRPHQREVLLLSAVCGLDTVELAWVLDVAADTAEQLVISARHRFTHSLTAAVSSARPAALVPAQAAEVHDGLTVAPAEAALARLPWRAPSGALRVRVLGAIPEETGTPGGPARPGSKRLWPTTPRWPLPLAEPNPFTNTGVFPAKELSPPEPGHKSRHEASTEPMPKVRGAAAGATGGFAAPRHRPALAAAPVLPDMLATPPPAAEKPEKPLAVEEGEGSAPESASPFSRALATGNWPNLQRTFSVGRPPPLVGRRTAGQVPGDVPGKDTTKPAAQEASPAAWAENTAALKAKIAAVKGRASALRGMLPMPAEKLPAFMEKLTVIASRLAIARNAFTRPPADPDPHGPKPAPETAPAQASTPVNPSAAADPFAQIDMSALINASSPAGVEPPEPIDLLDDRAEDSPLSGKATAGAETPTSTDHTATPAADTTDTTVTAGGTASPAGATTEAEVISEAEPRPEAKARPEGEPASEAEVTDAPRAVDTTARPHRHDRPKPIKLGEHHYDWLWELAGFILCVAIAMTVFFAVPSIITP
jgi:DNA-directed RNA polymerase specialized sigma24 family protein